MHFDTSNAPTKAEAEEDLAFDKANPTQPNPEFDAFWDVFKARHPMPSAIGGSPF